MVEDTPILSATEMYDKESSFSDISLMGIIVGDYSQRQRYSEALPSR